MTLSDVYSPISGEIEAVKSEMQKLAQEWATSATTRLAAGFFRAPGKFLRPALTLMSARCFGPLEGERRSRAIQAGFGVELIHAASLIHDDILDDDTTRRGQTTLNGQWGNKVALLVGDALYSRAFGVLTRSLPASALGEIATLVETMCSAEIAQARITGPVGRQEYFSIIEGKTAAFMALCCRIGTLVAGGDEKSLHAAGVFGLNFGLAYQLWDDVEDADVHCDEIDGPREASLAANRAREALRDVPHSDGRVALSELLDYLEGQQTQSGRKS